MLERLQKILARAGVASRRKSEQFITDGRVTVDRKIVTELGTKVEPTADIRLDGERIHLPSFLYMLVNKPRGVVCSSRADRGHPPVTDLVAHVTQRLFCVGRLDTDSCGLVLMTNDGDLTQRLTHPSFRVPKTYQVRVRGSVDDRVVARLRKGVYLAEGRVRCDRLTVKHVGKASSTLEIEIHQGINREIRRVLARVGLPVSELKRTAIGPLKLGTLKPGAHRKLSDAEVQTLYEASSQPRSAPKRTRSRSAPKRTPARPAPKRSRPTRSKRRTS